MLAAGTGAPRVAHVLRCQAAAAAVQPARLQQMSACVVQPASGCWTDLVRLVVGQMQFVLLCSLLSSWWSGLTDKRHAFCKGNPFCTCYTPTTTQHKIHPERSGLKRNSGQFSQLTAGSQRLERRSSQFVCLISHESYVYCCACCPGHSHLYVSNHMSHMFYVAHVAQDSGGTFVNLVDTHTSSLD